MNQVRKEEGNLFLKESAIRDGNVVAMKKISVWGVWGVSGVEILQINHPRTATGSIFCRVSG
jgi:hypothetical protein